MGGSRGSPVEAALKSLPLYFGRRSLLYRVCRAAGARRDSPGAATRGFLLLSFKYTAPSPPASRCAWAGEELAGRLVSVRHRAGEDADADTRLLGKGTTGLSVTGWGYRETSG
ncbi:hypothetical protein KIL84_002279 [Mauremys mutica]|uniref:Uncharacterized protein n=1 Tax=Mauremys mutica TaxID=74926 RepID=A0A9D4AZ48_9SAUR|nr:hypothetical protein KIL84_002279 [Mauremys mutica]